MTAEELHEDFPWQDSGPPRGEGLHVSDLIRAYAIRFKLLPGDIVKEPGVARPELPLELRARFTTGFLWEEALEYAFGRRMAARPAEIEYMGILASPDGLKYEDGAWVLEEYKSTWGSPKKDPELSWLYMAQVKAYTYMLRKIGYDVQSTVMRILYLKEGAPWRWNDVPPEDPPVPYRVRRLTFEDAELEMLWNMLLGEGKARGWL